MAAAMRTSVHEGGGVRVSVTKSRTQPLSMACANGMFALPRALVSQNKLRFRRDGFDLDLCYLHPRVIVMGYPAVGMEFVYRNPRSEVVRFLEARHEDKYFVYNFCSERERRYPVSVFSDRAACYPIEDHNVPTFEQLTAFCEHAAAWLNADPDRVVALHCKAGKGRAGMMACMLLVRMQYANSAAAAIERYNRVRVRDLRGLTVISQRKWVRYYEQLLLMRPQQSSPTVRPPNEPGFLMTELVIRNSLTGVAPPKLLLRVYQLDNASDSKTLRHKAEGYEQFSLREEICGSVLIEFKRLQCEGCRTQKHFKIWFNTAFITPDADSGHVVFTRSDMDWVAKDKKKRRIPAAMELEMVVEPNP
uniref:Phosphatidylinositol-3,4,5-trisphosphate 3-phosphatase n=1 Tax=Globisporangium ultimum (strain ATCC 200006 / CBS 805.95 / DAOM BR144) TaxID=431595 RepID=K3WTT8_GLOUD